MPLPPRPATLLPAVLAGAAMLAGMVGTADAMPQQKHRRGHAAAADRGQAQSDRRPQRQDWAQAQPQPRPRHRSEDALSDSVRRVEQRTRGQVLSAERVPYDGGNLNRIKVMDQRGRVRVYMDDPRQAVPPQDGNDVPTRDNDD